MNHQTPKSFLRSILFAATLATALITQAQGKPSPPAPKPPQERTTAKVSRTAQSPNPLVISLTKNLFKNEEYQAEYTVPVPYQAEEEYTYEVPYQTEETYSYEVPYQVEEPYSKEVPYEVDETYTREVPYQETEYYTEEVPYQDTETYTENVAYTERIPYTDWETDYRSEQKCENVTKNRQECRSEQQCYIVPGDGPSCRIVEECGTNVHGQPICKKREVCDGPSDGPQQRCENKQVCTQTPYTEYECRNVQVPYQREVTKYREETRYRQETRTRSVTKYRTESRSRQVTKYRQETATRKVTKYRTETGMHTVTKYKTEYATRTVTKYRTETGTRTVTKYRDEVRCCQTKTRKVFDRQLEFQVAVNFPADAVLVDQESDVVNVQLVSTDPVKVDIQVENSEWGYKVVNQLATGAAINIDLAVVPKYNSENAAESSISKLKLEKVSTRYQVSFRDSILSSKVKSQYVIVITDQLTGQVLREIVATQPVQGVSVTAVAASELPKKTKMVATLHVKREGPALDGGKLQFHLEIARN